MDTLEYIKNAFDLKNQKYYKPAIEMLYKALELENDNVEILYQIGELYFLMENFSRAEQYLEKIDNISPTHIPSIELRLKIYKKRNNLHKAYEISKILFDLKPNKQNLEILLDLLLCNKLYDEIDLYKNSELFDEELKIYLAKKLYEAGLKEQSFNIIEQCNENNENVIFFNARKHFDMGEIDIAKELFNSISKNSQNPELLNYIGIFELENMDIINAIKHFSKAITLDKTKSKYYFNLGNAYFFNGWMEEAKNAYTKAISIEPDNLDYHYSIAYLYNDTKNYEKAQKEVDEILKKAPLHKQANVLKAILLLNNKKPVDAIDILEKNLKEYNDDIFTKTTLSKVYVQLNNFSKAKKLLTEVTKQDPQNIKYLLDLIEIYIIEKDYENAEKLVNKIIKENQNYIEAYILAAKISYLQNDIEKTKYFAQEALLLDNNYSKSYYYLAIAREKENDLEEAIECLKRAILYVLNNPKYYAKMAEIYENLKDYNSALNYLSEAAELSDNNEYKFKYNELLKIYTKNKISNK